MENFLVAKVGIGLKSGGHEIAASVLARLDS